MSEPAAIELGLDTFGDVTRDDSGELISDAQAIRNVVDQAVLADQVGLSFFGVGEHHRREFAVSSPELVLAAAAARTEQIHLGTAVTVLSSDDPVRVYERFATLDAISSGRSFNAGTSAFSGGGGNADGAEGAEAVGSKVAMVSGSRSAATAPASGTRAGSDRARTTR